MQYSGSSALTGTAGGAGGVFLIMTELIEKWAGVGPDTAPEDADPVVLECARLLIAEPGGEQAVLLTFGLVNMAPYVLGRRGAPVERAVVDALAAAAEALDARFPRTGRCGHPAHPYTGILEKWDTDADALLDAPDVQVPLAAWDEAAACPHNAARWAATGGASVTALFSTSCCS